MLYFGVGRGLSVAVAVSQHVEAFDAVQLGVVLEVSVAVVVV